MLERRVLEEADLTHLLQGGTLKIEMATADYDTAVEIIMPDIGWARLGMLLHQCEAEQESRLGQVRVVK